ncbi:MAG: peroxiredoxin [Phycisphaera sp.]|nr:MAG: peroxiredoxin [Phycisphaera sp.]
MLPEGSPIPDVTIPATPGLCEEPTTLRDLVAEGPIVLYSYPADGSPMCTRQACMMRDEMSKKAEEFTSAGLRVVGVSPQDRKSHDKFASRHDLPFPIIADEKKIILRAIGGLGILGMPRRVTYLLLPDGTVGQAITADLRLSRHKQFIRAALAAVET